MAKIILKIKVAIASADKSKNKWNSHMLLMEVQDGTAILQSSLTRSNKFKHTLTYYSVIPSLDIYPRRMKIYFHTKS